MQEKQKWVLKICLTVIFVLLLGFVSVKYLFPIYHLAETGTSADITEQFGIFAPLWFVLLIALQIVIAFIPGGPLEMTAGALFGGWLGTILTIAGVLLGDIAVYCLVKRFGRSLVNFFISEEKIKKLSVLEDEKKLTFWVFLLFLIPGIPKDVLTYIIPLTRMPSGQFFILSTLARLPALAASVFLGSGLSNGSYWFCFGILCFAVMMVFIGMYFKKYILKQKERESIK